MFKIPRTLGPILLTAGLILAGCNFPSPTQTSPTATLPPELSTLAQTPLPADNPAACVAGSWQVQDITPILKAAIPPEIQEASEMTITGSSGMFRYDFLPDGTMKGSAEQYRLLGKIKRGPLNLDLVAELNGNGTGHYSVNTQTQELILTDLVNNGFTLDIRIAGISVSKLSSDQLKFWFGGAREAQLPFECSGTTLAIPIDLNGQNLPVSLSRINP